MTQISNNNYQNLLLEIQKQIEDTQDLIILAVTRQKVVMAWNIGKSIDEYLPSSAALSRGEGLIEQLSQDVKISKTVLYKMRVFYQAYPQLPQNSEKLNWSHYRSLSGVKDENERQFLEKLAVENSWGNRKLVEEIKKIKEVELSEKEVDSGLNLKIKTISPVRGDLFTYPLVNLPNSADVFVDYGFNVFKNIEDFSEVSIESGKTVQSFKNADGSYLFKEISISKKRMNIYKAYLERVVDGDTIRVILDLGFGVLHRQILRLKGINAPEIKSDEGKESKAVLEGILKNTPFLIIKTIKIDIFGRYVADVFFDEKKDVKTVAQMVADDGVYLNQMLLDKGVAEIF